MDQNCGEMKAKEIEKVQLEVGKRLLGVSKKMASAVVRGELGWWSMRAQRDFKVLMYWARLIRMDDTRLAKQVYLERRKQEGKRVRDWCTRVHETLVSLNLNHIWQSEKVGAEKDWKSLIKASIQAREEKQWREEMTSKPKLRTYRSLKFILEKEEYLHTIPDDEERRTMTMLRGGTNALRIERGRWKGELLEDRVCTLCAKGEVENELHMLLCCSAYERERSLLFKNIREGTHYDCKIMEGQHDWLLEILLGVGCPEKPKRQVIQLEVARYLATVLRKRYSILKASGLDG